MRPVFYYILIVAAVAVIATFFVSQHSKHVQIGYELMQLRRQRDALRERGRKLEFEISKAANHDALAETAEKLGLRLQAPIARTPSD